jgi:hypothetical protein
MSKPLKIVLIIVVSLLLLGIAGVVVADTIVKSKIEKLLQNSLPENLEFRYGDIDVNTWKGRVVVASPRIKTMGSTTKQVNAKLEMDSLMIDGFGYWDYIFNDKINIESIELRSPIMAYYHNPLVDKEDYKYSKLEKLKQDITIQRINIQKGDLTVSDINTDSLMLKTENFTANMMGVHLNGKTVKQRIPFSLKDYNVHFDNLFYQLSEYENIEIQSSRIMKEQASFNNIKMYTKYSSNKLSNMIAKERDHFDINIKSIVLKDQDFGYKQDSLFYFTSPSLEILDPNLIVYRNKLVLDDDTVKPLYSKMLRNLNFDLTLNSILIKNASIKYIEKVKSDAIAGEIDFSRLDATISNLSNTYKSPDKTSININATFMKQTPIDIEWYFDINDVNDHFIFKADMGQLNANKMNMFTEPNLNVRLEGEIHKLYFTIDGYDNTSTVDLKLNYEDFKVIIMQKKERKENKFLSAVVNIFVSKDSDKRENQFRNGSASVERDKTKSIFNFIWLNASKGLLNAMTGSGKDKK